jgi:UDP-glucuronate decarboxylase
MNSDSQGPVNLGNPSELSVLELAEIIRSQLSPQASITHLPLPADDPHRRKPSIQRAKELLGWTPKIELKDGLKSTIESVSSQMPAGLLA